MTFLFLDYVRSFVGDTRPLATKEARSVASILQMYYPDLFGKLLSKFLQVIVSSLAKS